MRKINQFVKVKMWFWMKISLFQSLGEILRSSPRQKQHFHASQRQSSQGKKGSWTLQQPRKFEKKLKLYTLGWPISVISLKFQTDEWSKRRFSKGTCGKSASSGFFGSNFQGVDVGDDWKIRFFKEVFLVGDMFFFSHAATFAMKNLLHHLPLPTSALKKDTMSFYRRHPPLSMPTCDYFSQTQKNAKMPLGF